MFTKLLSAIVPLHHAAEHGYLNRVPQELLTSEALVKRCTNGRIRSVLDLAVSNGHLDQVPRHLLDVEMLMEDDLDKVEPLIFTVAMRGQLDCVPEEIFEYDVVKESGEDESGKLWDTFLHRAAYYGHLNQVPRKYLTSDVLMLESGSGTNLISVARDRGFLDQLLGLELSDICRYETGDEWWERNNIVRRERGNLEASPESPDMDLF